MRKKTYNKIVNATAVAIILLVIAGMGALGWFVASALFGAMEERDEAFQLAVERYEECVRTEYGRSPTAFAQEHGYYPDCDSQRVSAE